ncbi:hypothetical protein [Deminuibacter soli]|nr:hypothetical protein [Deminuibacter soli]
MRKNLILAATLGSLMLFAASCKKTDITSGGTVARQAEPNRVWINQDANGNYYTTYGYNGGITFGSILPHPLDSDPGGIYDGAPIPTVNSVNSITPPDAAWGNVNGEYFDVLIPTFPGAVTQDQVSDYFDKLNKYYNSLDDAPGSVAYPAPLASSNGSGGVIEVRGKVVRDHTSPTGMSATKDTDPYTPPGFLLGAVKKAPYGIQFYGASVTTGGNVMKINITAAGSNIAYSGYSLTYTIDATQTYAHVTGTITITAGNVLTINDDIMLP